jgi:hypothetical protein
MNTVVTLLAAAKSLYKGFCVSKIAWMWWRSSTTDYLVSVWLLSRQAVHSYTSLKVARTVTVPLMSSPAMTNIGPVRK